jgi:hypothetical protein
MAINKISGNILQDNLQRGSNLSVQGNLAFFDITNLRVGIKTDNPSTEFEVIGTAKASNVNITSTTANRVMYTDSNKNAVTSGNLTFDGSVLGLTGTANINNLTLSGNTITSTGNITLTASTGNYVVLSGTGGYIIPIGNTAQRPSPPSTATVRFNSNTQKMEIYTGSQWTPVGADFASITSQIINGDGSTVTFTLDQSTTAAAIIVSTNGVVQIPDVAYTVAGNQITFVEAPLTTDVVNVRFISIVTTVNAITNDAGDAEVTVTVSGIVNISTAQSLQLPTYTVAQANSLGNTSAGQLIYVSNGDSGNPCLAVYANSAWKRISFGANIST